MLNHQITGDRCMYIAIEGVIGVGKTTLARLLQPSFENSELLLEVFEENPFLTDFYGDRDRYAFQTQIFFLLSRYRQQHHIVPGILKQDQTLLADYTFSKDALFARINLHGDELNMYHRVHEALAEKIPLPDLTVYLSANVNTLMTRIAQRDRSYERSMQRGYIAELVAAYDEFFSKTKSPALVIDSNSLDFVQFPDHLKLIENQIREALKISPYQLTLLDGD
jgi:deoxyguanosine kinase